MQMAALVLAHRTDAGAHAVAMHLERRLGRGSVMLLRPERLALGRWSQHIDSEGRAHSRLRVSESQRIDSAQVRVVLNRLRRLPQPRFVRSPPRDREYASAELEATVLGWLGSLGSKVVHDVSRHPWTVTPLPRCRWLTAAAAAGLPIEDATMVSIPRLCGATSAVGGSRSPSGAQAKARRSHVLIAGDGVSGPIASEWGARCHGVAHALGLPLLQFTFTGCGRRGWMLQDVSPLPDLDVAEDADRVARFLAGIATRGDA